MTHSFPGLSELCWWLWRKCVLQHESLMVWWRCATRPNSALSLCLQVCVSIIASSLSHSLFLSLLHLCFSHTAERRLLGKLSPPMLCGLSSDTAFLRVRCLPSALLPLADTTDGKAGSQSDWALWMVSTPTTLCLWCLSERRPLWPGYVCFFAGAGQMSRGQRQETQVMGSQFGMEGGRSKMEIQRAVYLPHGKPAWLSITCSQCVHIGPQPNRLGVQHILRCIVGPVVVQTEKGGGVSGLHAQPSQWRSFREAGRCLFMKGKFKSKSKKNWKRWMIF